MRDTLRNEKYFTAYIDEKTAGKERMMQRINEGGIPVERAKPLQDMLFVYQVPIMLAAYSRGDNIDTLIPVFQETVHSAQKSWSAEQYEIMLQLVSLAILLEIDCKTLDILKLLIDQSNMRDWLLNFLLQSRYPEISFDNCQMYIPQVYDKLKDIYSVTDKETALKIYLNEWYKLHNDASWFDAHKDSSKNLYYGYWSLEAGAFAKILHIPDSTLKESSYYPYDLVHYK